jgi:hypothetical protein
MEWYIPITILPGIGMLVLSTTSQMMTLSGEVNSLLIDRCSNFDHMIARKKIKQLGLLTRASTALYIASGLYVLSGIFGVLEVLRVIANPILYLGTLFFFSALVFLIIYALRTVRIRELQFDNNKNL